MPTTWIDKTDKRQPRGTAMGLDEAFTRDVYLSLDRVGLPSRTATDATSRLARRLRLGREAGERRRQAKRDKIYSESQIAP